MPEFLDEIPRDLFGTGPAERMLMIRRDVEIRDKDDQPLPPGLIIYSRGLDGKDSRGLKEDGDDVGLRIPLPPAGVKPE